jgi:phosphate/sulfate permease
MVDGNGVLVCLQVCTACANSFAHGSNEVANAIGPLAAIYQVSAELHHHVMATAHMLPACFMGMQADISMWLTLKAIANLAKAHVCCYMS